MTHGPRPLRHLILSRIAIFWEPKGTFLKVLVIQDFSHVMDAGSTLLVIVLMILSLSCFSLKGDFLLHLINSNPSVKVHYTLKIIFQLQCYFLKWEILFSHENWQGFHSWVNFIF